MGRACLRPGEASRPVKREIHRSRPPNLAIPPAYGAGRIHARCPTTAAAMSVRHTGSHDSRSRPMTAFQNTHALAKSHTRLYAPLERIAQRAKAALPERFTAPDAQRARDRGARCEKSARRAATGRGDSSGMPAQGGHRLERDGQRGGSAKATARGHLPPTAQEACRSAVGRKGPAPPPRHPPRKPWAPARPGRGDEAEGPRQVRADPHRRRAHWRATPAARLRWPAAQSSG